jgi:putative heme-binding domain-containing protein
MPLRVALLRPVLAVFFALLALPTAHSTPRASDALALRSGDRVVLLGDTLIEREQFSGWVELMLTSRFPAADVRFRNLGWSADTPAGASRTGLSLRQAGREGPDEGWDLLRGQLRDTAPSVVLVGYGMANSFDGADGLPRFLSEYRRLLDTLATDFPEARVVLLTPIRHERLGAPWPDPAPHQENLDRYAAAIVTVAGERNLPILPLHTLLAGSEPGALTENGIHLSEVGYRRLAERIEDFTFGSAGAWRTQSAERIDALRQAILRKNEWFFHRSRPANMAYIFGFRRKEQGQNAVEITQFDPLIAAEEARIAQLRTFPREAAPATPRRVGNLTARSTPQPAPKFEVAEGLEVTLWAQNPLLEKPIQMNFDSQGRLWVASSGMYPQIEPGQALTDRIIVLEDSTGSGRADRATVFADGLLIPMGVIPGDDGCYVAQSTELLHFRDTDGDGRADSRRIVLSSFGTEDTHHNLHTPRWGPDGRLYLNQSIYTRSHVETPHGVLRHRGGGVFRVDPRDLRMEVVYRGWVNAWGHQFDAFGQSFMTDGAGNDGIHWGIPGASYLAAVPSRRLLGGVSPGQYPKFSGIEFVHSPLFPADWQGNVITGDFRAHRVVRFAIEDQGAGYVTRELPDILRSVDSSFRPIDVAMGPDGAIYIADWSNSIIQHGEVDFRDPRRDKEHGRIWRVAPKGSTALARENLSSLATQDLLDRLNSSASYTQTYARRVLIERGAPSVAPELSAWLQRHPDDASALQGLWLSQAFNLPLDPLLDRLLRSAAPEIRAAAVRARPDTRPLAELATLAADPHPRVRVEAVRALGRTSSAEGAALALGVLTQPMDRFLDYALWLTLNELAEPWLTALRSGTWSPEGRDAQLTFGLSAIEPSLAAPALTDVLRTRGLPADGSGPWIELIGSVGDADAAARLLALVADPSTTDAVRLRGLVALAALARERRVSPAAGPERIVPLLQSADVPVRLATTRVLGVWRTTAAVAPLLALAAQEGATDEERTARWTALQTIGGDAVITGLSQLVRSATSPRQRREAVLALAATDLERALPDVASALQSLSDPADVEAAWRALLGITGASDKLAASLTSATLNAATAKQALRFAREGGRHPALVQTLMQIAGVSSTTEVLSGAELIALATESMERGDAARGERIYRQPQLACLACHAIGGVGGRVGPDLTSIGASAPADYLLESLLYPQAKTKEGYHAVALTTRDGRDYSGVIVRENEREVVLRGADNQLVTLSPRELTKRTDFGSLMPAGLVDSLTPAELRDLVRFLSQLGRPGDFDAARGGVARLWRSYVANPVNQPIGMEPVVRGDFTLSDWRLLPSLTDGSVDRGLLTDILRAEEWAREFYVATAFNAPRSGRATFRLQGPVLRAWLNGQPITPEASFSAELAAGDHVLVFELNKRDLSTKLTLRSDDVSFANE